MELKIKAVILAQQVKSIARRIEFDANDYDTKWPLEYVRELTSIADEFLEEAKSKPRKTSSRKATTKKSSTTTKKPATATQPTTKVKPKPKQK